MSRILVLCVINIKLSLSYFLFSSVELRWLVCKELPVHRFWKGQSMASNVNPIAKLPEACWLKIVKSFICAVLEIRNTKWAKIKVSAGQGSLGIWRGEPFHFFAGYLVGHLHFPWLTCSSIFKANNRASPSPVCALSFPLSPSLPLALPPSFSSSSSSPHPPLVFSDPVASSFPRWDPPDYIDNTG